ncbi:glucoamylase S1 isoform X2 [Solenopsis invicta]|uniref:glucoamylase S1 isoform X2 n=1 Tax=Solenopsis invicta TaxID=13686 RepID=UPI000595C4A4|nr:glucoamylase S1 isoform X2 [Solenopsis invicta]
MLVYTRTQSSVVCPVAKMEVLSGVLLLLLTCQLAMPTPIFNRDGTDFYGRSSGFGDTIKDWFRVLKDRIVGKWREWFGDDSSIPNLTPQDILTIDKTLEGRVSAYPGIFIDLFTGNDYDSDSDEWDIIPLLPRLPDWTPDFRKVPADIPTRSPVTTPRIQPTTSQQTTQTVTPTQSILTSTESTVTTTEATVTSTESISPTTQLITTSIRSIVEPTASEEILTSSESVLINREPVTVPTEPKLTYTESAIIGTTIPFETTVLSVDSTSFAEPIATSINSIETSVKSTSFTEPIETSVKSIETSVASTVITTEAIMTSTEELTAITTTESPGTSTELILPVFNKRVEDNETINKPRTTKKPRPASAEVIM